ncbi:MAG TPA: excalibur calcium-binding domain-containing protein [Acidimicrobiales bacterium]|nr:excalibur calcium-binding domain-containing protein [Acidimicrobiales bacterium]
MSEPNGPWQDYGPRDDERHTGASRRRRAPRGRSPGDAVRAAAGELAWRYRSAPLWARATADVAAATLVLLLILGVSLAVRREGPQRAAAVGSTTTAPTTSSTAPTTTTTTLPKAVPPPPTTTTTTPPTTAAPPSTRPTVPTTVAPPPTEPPPPTTEPAPYYANCREAWRAGALPLDRGDPGYGPHLDADGDGRACEWGE